MRRAPLLLLPLLLLLPAVAGRVAAQEPPAPAPAPAPTPAPGDDAARERDQVIEQLRAELEALRSRVTELEGREAERDRTNAEITDRLGRLAAAAPPPQEPRTIVEGWDLKLGGYVKVNVIHDFGAIGSEDDFAENTIPVKGTPEADKEGRTKLQARETRLSTTLTRETSMGLLKLYIEGDFADGDSNGFRLRHAYAELAGWLVGQTWSTFMDDAYIPDTLDFDGPGTAVFTRRTLVRYTAPLTDASKWSVAIEDPTAEFDNVAGLPGAERDAWPDLVGRIRADSGRWHGQIAGVLRELTFDGDPPVGDSTAVGWGVNLTGRMGIGEKDGLSAKVGFGDGIARYFQDLNGQDSDAVVTAAGDLEPLPVLGWGAGFQHFWSTVLRSNLIYSTLQVNNMSVQPADAYKQTQYAALNLIYSPEPYIDWGVETLWGTRENLDGASGSDTRLQFAFKYKF